MELLGTVEGLTQRVRLPDSLRALREALDVHDSEKVVRELLKHAGIRANGGAPHDIEVHDQRFYRRVLSDGSLGLGESYMDGWWDCAALDEMVTKLLRSQIESELKPSWRQMAMIVQAKALNLQSLSRAFEVGERHYDIGNDLYEAMLDRRMVYTSAYWRDAKTLDEAQEAKLDLVCRKIGARPGMKILELGCGWGSFAKFAAERYGAHVTGFTVSKEQAQLGSERCKGLPVTIELEDYRRARGTYDAVVSIGIMEHIGYKNYRTYMELAASCLEPDGIAFVHTIGGNKSKKFVDPWYDKYIFPNALLPSMAQLSRAMEGLFVLEDVHNFGPDYDRTLMVWDENFEASWPSLRQKYGERFYRMWKFYLLSAAATFRSRHGQLFQLVMTRPGRPQPDCRKL